MVDLSAISSAGLTAQGLANIILVNPQKNVGIKPQLKAGTTGATEAKSFIFHYEGENTVSLDADITDHFIEDNTAIQDQIALKPEMITTHGYIGELTDATPEALIPLKTAADKLTTLTPFVPVLSATAIIAFNLAAQAYATALLAASAAVSAWSSVPGVTTGLKPAQTKQQQAFQLFYGYYRSRQLFTVQTPWAVFEDMAIKTIRAIQDEDTRMVTDFEITFKKMRFAQTITTGAPQLTGRAANQAATVVDHGVSTPVKGPDLSAKAITSGVP